MKKLKSMLAYCSLGLSIFVFIGSLAMFTSGNKDDIFAGVFFLIVAILFLIPFVLYMIKSKPEREQKKLNKDKAKPETPVKKTLRSTSRPYEIPPERMPVERKPLLEPFEGYSLTYHYENVEISCWEYIPDDVKIGNRIVFMQEPTNEYDDKAVLLTLVPQRRKLGYLYRGKMQDMVNDYLNRGDKVIARLSYLTFNPCKIVKIDIAFYRKVKTKNKK